MQSPYNLKSNNKAFIGFVLVLFSILACNVPGNSPLPSVEDQAATSIAATLTNQAQNREDGPVTATLSPISNPTSSNSNGSGATITPTFSVPMLTVLEQTNCRTGPGQDYEIVFTYLPNAKLVILGRYDIENYWLVKSDESPTGSCWLWGEFVEVTGSFWVVPSVTPPATATQSPPQAPSIQNWEFLCSVGQMTITIDWTDRASDETGYRVFRDGNVVAQLPANSTTYTETIALLSGESVEYIIQVHNATAEVNSTPIQLTC